ncbi:MAG: DUF2934 domain-containing protein [bacterium]
MTMKQHFRDEIAQVAYDLYERRGRAQGYDLENWLQAEKMVMERHAKEIKKEAKKEPSAKKTSLFSRKKK